MEMEMKIEKLMQDKTTTQSKGFSLEIFFKLVCLSE